MNASRNFYQKIGYLTAIVFLLFPIAWLARPSAMDDVGGKLSQLRKDFNLGQAELGQIDPASETIRLASLGLRGIAVSMLWSKANHYKKVEDWTAFRAALEQLAHLQPYFIQVWRYQAWNLTYNVSVELDAVPDRYYYVKEGISYLKDGIAFNRDNPILLADLGWFIGNKIGRADERKEYRELFRKDDDYHKENNPNLPPEQRDNWLVSKGWYDESVRAVDEKKQSLGQKNPTTFYAASAMSQINYADAIEDEGTFGARASAAWKTGDRLWNEYGNRELRSSRGLLIRLADQQRVEEEIKQISADLEKFDAGLIDRMRTEALASLTPEEKKAWDSLPEEPTDEETAHYHAAEEKLNVTTENVADRLAREHPEQAASIRRLTTRLSELNSRLAMIRSNRDVSNYAYWDSRTTFEQTPNALQARELAWQAAKEKAAANPFEARTLYEKSFALWAKVLEEFPQLVDDGTTGSDLVDVIGEYADVLEQMELSLADDEVADAFPLWEILSENDAERRFADAIEKWQIRLGKSPSDDQTPVEKPAIDPADVEKALSE